MTHDGERGSLVRRRRYGDVGGDGFRIGIEIGIGIAFDSDTEARVARGTRNFGSVYRAAALNGMFVCAP